METFDLVFRPIDLHQHREIFLAFIRDTHLCSFGSMDGFSDDIHGEELLVERIRKRLIDEPLSCLHVWKNEQIVGQLHLGQFVDPDVGYINLLYVVPECRGMGIASLIEDYASAFLQGQGFQSARLSVADRSFVHNMAKVFG